MGTDPVSPCGDGPVCAGKLNLLYKVTRSRASLYVITTYYKCHATIPNRLPQPFWLP